MCSRKASACIGTLATLALLASTIGWAVSNDTAGPDRYGSYTKRATNYADQQRRSADFMRKTTPAQQQPGQTDGPGAVNSAPSAPKGSETLHGLPGNYKPLGPVAHPTASANGFGTRVDCNTNGTDDATEVAGIDVWNQTTLIISGNNLVSDDFNNAFSPATLRVTADDFNTTVANTKFNRVNVRGPDTTNRVWIIKIWSNDPNGFAVPPTAVPACSPGGDPGDGSAVTDSPLAILYTETITANRTVVTDPPNVNDSLNLAFNLSSTVNLASINKYWLEAYHNDPNDPDSWGFSPSSGDLTTLGPANSNMRRTHSVPTGQAPCNVAEIWSRGTDFNGRFSLQIGAIDRNQNNVPDECDDCNTNGTADQSEAYADCDTNLNPDACDIAVGNSVDCNTDLTPDECGRDCNTSETDDACELMGNDCNTTQTPDECELFRNEVPYILDDGISEISLGITGIAPPFIWLNQFTVGAAPDDGEIHFIRMSWGTIDESTNAILALYNDPNGNGSPEDGQILWQDIVNPANNGTDILKEYSVPDVVVGGPGDNFFVACYVRGGPNSFPMNIDQTVPQGKTWIKINQGPVLPDQTFLANLGGGDGIQTLDQFAVDFAGNAVLRAIAGVDEDCDNNTTPDDCELVPDCDTNGTPDRCDPDCNANNTPDACDIAASNSDDVNTNGVPDECEDCDSNNTVDTLQANYRDCNTNDKMDICEIPNLSGDLQDCDTNTTPDICETDCNTNGAKDLCDIPPVGFLDADCNSNGIPDQCEDAIDCNTDGTPDPCQPGGSIDCNTNGTTDLCDRLYGFVNGTPDNQSNDTLANLRNGGPTNYSFLDAGTADGPMCAEDFTISKGACVLIGASIEVIACKDTDPPNQPEAAIQGFNGKAVVGVYRSTGAVNSERPTVDPDFSSTVNCSQVVVIGFPGVPAVYDVWRYSTTQSPNLRVAGNGKWWVAMQPQTTSDQGFAFMAVSQATNSNPPEPVIGRMVHWRPGLNLTWISNDIIGLINQGTEPALGVAMSVAFRDDCNTNNTLDECEIAATPAIDANVNGVIDKCEDCNTNNIPDPTEASLRDCNSNGYPDICDIRFNWWPDCNTNNSPDNCEVDCDNDGIPDACQLTGNDCNTNKTLDPCEAYPDITTNASATVEPRKQLRDCNTNRTLDVCESLANCNTNNTPDICDINPINRIHVNAALHPGLTFSNGFYGIAVNDEDVTGTNGMIDPDNTQVLAEDFTVQLLPWTGMVFFGGLFNLSIGEDFCTDVETNGDPGAANDSFDVLYWTHDPASNTNPLNHDMNSNGNPLDDDFLRVCTAANGQIARVPTINGTMFYLRYATPLTLPTIAGQGKRWLEWYYTGPSGSPNGGDFFTGISRNTAHLLEYRFAIETPSVTWRSPFNADDKNLFNFMVKAGSVVDVNSNGTPDECDPTFPPCDTPGGRCKGDMNGDLRVDGQDVHCYVRCFIQGVAGFTANANCPASPTTQCGCIDMDGNTTVNGADLTAFINKLLTDANVACP